MLKIVQQAQHQMSMTLGKKRIVEKQMKIRAEDGAPVDQALYPEIMNPEEDAEDQWMTPYEKRLKDPWNGAEEDPTETPWQLGCVEPIAHSSSFVISTVDELSVTMKQLSIMTSDVLKRINKVEVLQQKQIGEFGKEERPDTDDHRYPLTPEQDQALMQRICYAMGAAHVAQKMMRRSDESLEKWGGLTPEHPEDWYKEEEKYCRHRENLGPIWRECAEYRREK
jgi:hypothetical protein